MARVLLLLAVLASALMADAKTYIVCIGMQNYPGRVNDTYLCAKDARSVQSLFIKNGNATTALLLDRQATRANILQTMRRLFRQATASDVVAIFYSGHGDHGALCAYDGNLSYDDIYKVFCESKAQRRLAFINACYSGTMRKKPVAETYQNKQMMFFLSSRSSETSLELPMLKNGLFTTYLIKGLSGAADSNHDKQISARELFVYVQRMVISKSKQQQHPVMWGQFNNNMVIMKWNR